MDASTDIGEFLIRRRAGVTPEQVGLPAYGSRRVNGLRREGVAALYVDWETTAPASTRADE